MGQTQVDQVRAPDTARYENRAPISTTLDASTHSWCTTIDYGYENPPLLEDRARSPHAIDDSTAHPDDRAPISTDAFELHTQHEMAERPKSSSSVHAGGPLLA